MVSWTGLEPAWSSPIDPKSIACTYFATRTLIFLGRFEAFASGDVRTFLCRPHSSATYVLDFVRTASKLYLETRPHLTLFGENFGEISIFGFFRSLLSSALFGNLPRNTGFYDDGIPVISRFLSLTCLPFHHRRSEVIISVPRKRKNVEK